MTRYTRSAVRALHILDGWQSGSYDSSDSTPGLLRESDYGTADRRPVPPSRGHAVPV
jgi:hypothetical protein